MLVSTQIATSHRSFVSTMRFRDRDRATQAYLVARLGGVLNLRQVSFTKLAAEQIKRHTVDRASGGRIVSSAFVPHECMGTVEFVPAEICSSVGQCIVNRGAAFAGNVRILSAKHNQEFALDLRDSIERVIVQAFAQTSLVDVGRIAAGRREDLGVGRGSEGKVSTDTETHGADLSGAFRM